jgi:hypothetical protein
MCDRGANARRSIGSGRGHVRIEAVERVHDANYAVRLRKHLQHAAPIKSRIRLTNERRYTLSFERASQAARYIGNATDIADAAWRNSALAPLTDCLTAHSENLTDLTRRDLKGRSNGSEGVCSGSAVSTLVGLKHAFSI